MASGKVERGAPENFTLSGSANITITDQNCMKFGRIVIGSVRFSVDTAISANKMVINGMPRAQTTLANGYSFGACASSRDGESFTIMNSTSGNIYSNTSVATGNVMLSFCYIAES